MKLPGYITKPLATSTLLFATSCSPPQLLCDDIYNQVQETVQQAQEVNNTTERARIHLDSASYLLGIPEPTPASSNALNALEGTIHNFVGSVLSANAKKGRTEVMEKIHALEECVLPYANSKSDDRRARR